MLWFEHLGFHPFAFFAYSSDRYTVGSLFDFFTCLTDFFPALVFIQHFSKHMPYVKFILPTAPTQPVTMNMGMNMPSWYDITGLDERSNENCNGIDDSRERISNILKTEHESTGLPYERMVLAGFSQGGALSLFTGFQLPEKIAGVVVLSGYLPAARKFKVTPGLEQIPVLHCHGTQDPLVNYALAQKTKEKVGAVGVKSYTIKSYPLGHTVDWKELSDVLTFLKAILPPDDSCKIKLKDVHEMSVKELREAIRKSGLGHKAVGLMEKSEFVQLLQDHRDGKL
jgi:lysophospholipase-2